MSRYREHLKIPAGEDPHSRSIETRTKLHSTPRFLLSLSLALAVSLAPAHSVSAADSQGAAGASVASAAVGVPVATAAAVAAEAPAQGPEAAPAAAAAAPIEEVIVTGSRIPQPNMTSTSPIQVVSAQEILQTGTTDISTLINQLPQNFQNSVADFSNSTNPLTSAGGLSTADLRGLGPQRTLVLVNGRRLGVGDASTLNPNPAPDLDQIPAPLVERIDVVTGGASAVYGSDAIAGVVNFVMKQNFEGVQINGQMGVDNHDNRITWMQNLETAAGFNAPNGNVWDGQNRSLSIIFGSNFEGNKGNVTGYFVYYDADPVSQGSRDFSGCLLHAAQSTNPNVIDTPFCDGSANSNLYIPSFNPSPTALYSVVGNQLLPYPQSGSVPPALFNSSPYQYLSRGDTRYTAGFSAHYDINDYARPYTEFNYMNDRSTTNVGPGALFGGANPFNPSGTGGFLVNCTPANPLLSAQEVGILCNPANFSPPAANLTEADILMYRRDIEGGPREASYEHNNWRGVFGIKGDFADAWSYDAYASDYYTSLFQNNTGYLSATKVQNALLVGGTAAAPTCLGGQSGCVPYNIWTQGAITPQQLAYIETNGTNQGTVNERIINASITGDLGKYGVKSPAANEGIAVVGGFEHRNEFLDYAPDQAELSNDLLGFAGAGVSIDGGYNVTDGFFEARLPLVQQKPFFEDLVLHGAYRRSDYSTAAGGVNTYAIDLQWAPTADFRLRGSFQRAIRAPNIIELLTPQSVTSTSVVSSDPCAGPTPTASPAECAHTGVSAAQYGHIQQCPAGQCATLLGGNPNLQPEIANTISYGVTFTPTFLAGFTASIDYYSIILKDEINNVPQTTTLQECLTTGNPTFCQNVVRTSIGTLFGTTIQNGGWISATNVNTAVATVEGVDVQLAYKWNLPVHWGSMSATFSGSYLSHAETQPTSATARYDCAGLYGPTCQTVNPKWRHNMRLNWDTPINVLFSAQWRFIGSTTLDHNTGNPALIDNSPPYGPGIYDSFDARLPNISYLDLSAIWTVNKVLTFRVGVNNVLDKDPPVVSAALSASGSPNTYPTYDLLGRELYAAFTATF
jgi:iron complex outermembrane recepter protein